MSTQTKFSIGTPCKEDWNQMTPQEQGRFCALCQKCVVDLTQKSQGEIADIYAENEGNVCGRMTVKQVKEARQPSEKHFYWFGKGLQRAQRLALAFFAAFLLWFAPTKAQSIEEPLPPPPIEEYHLLGDVIMEPMGESEVSGVIFWKGGIAVKEKVWVKLDGPESAEVHEGKFMMDFVEPGERILTVYSEPHGKIIFEQKIQVPKDGKLVKDIELALVKPANAPKDAQNPEENDLGDRVKEGLEVLVTPIRETVEFFQPEEEFIMGEIAIVEHPPIEKPIDIPNDEQVEDFEMGIIEPVEEMPEEILLGKIAPVIEPVEEPVEVVQIKEKPVKTCNFPPLPQTQIGTTGTGEPVDPGTDFSQDSGNSTASEATTAPSGQQGNGSLKAFPNPTRDRLQLEFPEALSGKVIVRIRDIDGALLEESEFQADGMRQYPVSLEKYSGGIYLISIESQGFTAETKAVKL